MSKKKRERKKAKDAAKKAAMPKRKLVKKAPSKKKKIEFTLVAPKLFHEKELGTTVAKDPAHVIGRSIFTSMRDITGKMNMQNVLVRFMAQSVRGNKIPTFLYETELNRGYLRRLTRRKRSRVESVVDIVTRDKQKVRVKINVFTVRRITTSQKSAVRKIATAQMRLAASSLLYDDFMAQVIFGKINLEVSKRCKIIAPIKRVEVRKTERLTRPTLEAFKRVKKSAEDAVEPTIEPASA
ncbi:MAG: 30S ribosomal protein S3ae [Candidatus Diapherotrites archaeon]|nr:30S ribosomal protein S3ae [Candidatus Diapherotrites archaeon]